jgi:hypothetical protein
VIHVSARQRGTAATVVVAILIAVLYVVLQPDGERPRAAPAQEQPGTSAAATATTTTTTTLAPEVQLCDLAREFADAAATVDPNVVARLAETFYTHARDLVSGPVRVEYDAAARYYTEYNAIGEPYEYDTARIEQAGNGQRWAQLQQRPPLGVEEARVDVGGACQVDLPPPPTVSVPRR